MSTPRHIYAVRHCERENEANRVWFYNSHFGRDNPPLSEHGMRQAEELRSEFRKIHIDYCFSSPYERCVQTAATILKGRPACKINIEPGFLESGHLIRESGARQASYQKSLELAERDEYRMQINANYRQYFTGPQEYEFIDQNVRACFPRVRQTMEKLIKKCEGDILIVTHQAPLAAIQELLLDDSNPKFPGTATVSKYVERPNALGTFDIEYLCDNSHLSNKGNLSGFSKNRRHRENL